MAWTSHSPILAVALAALAAIAAPVEAAGSHDRQRHHHHHIDHSGRRQTGLASYYRPGSTGGRTAEGAKARPGAMTAASKTLPLGTRAKVTNERNGKSAVVTINDRGPFVKGRILDVSPKAADRLGLKSKGVAPVRVKPIAVPQPDGSIKRGGGG